MNERPIGRWVFALAERDDVQKFLETLLCLAMVSVCCVGCDAKKTRIIQPIERFESAEELAAYEKSFNEAAEAAKSGDQ